VVTKNKVHGKKWEVSYKSLIYSTDKSATPILVELLRDDNLYVRAFTAKALGFIGDKRALDELKRVAEKDKSSRVRSRAKWAYEQISGGKLRKESLQE
jgi:HEAT repeat protein